MSAVETHERRDSTEVFHGGDGFPDGFKRRRVVEIEPDPGNEFSGPGGMSGGADKSSGVNSFGVDIDWS